MLSPGSGPVSGMDDQFVRVVALIAQQPVGPDARDGAAGFLQRLCAAGVDEAFTLIRDHARRTNRRLGDVARSIVTDPARRPDLTA